MNDRSVIIHEFDWIYIKGERRNTIRVIMQVGDRKFKRLFHHGYPPSWEEVGIIGFLQGKQFQELESIFKAWCLDNNKDINNPAPKILTK